jgi:hypothetical protein
MFTPELHLGERIRELAERFLLGGHRAAFFVSQARPRARGQNARTDIDQEFWRNWHGGYLSALELISKPKTNSVAEFWRGASRLAATAFLPNDAHFEF